MKVYLIHNPVAGQHDHTAELDEVVAYLGQQGWDVTIKRTQDESDATAFAREAVDNHCDMAIAVGGDGTLGQVASGLAKSDVTLGLIPVGTGNVWARLFNIPIWTPTNRSGLMDAAKLLIDGKVKRIDLGRVRDRYFVLYAGLGIDAALANQVEPHRELRRNLGNVTYVVAAASMSLQMRGTRATIVIDGQVTRQRVLLVLVTNVPVYGTVWVAPQAKLDDGYLDVFLFKGENALDVLSHTVKMMVGSSAGDPRIEYYRAKRVEVYGTNRLPIQVDGDPLGDTPAIISVEPQTLNVLIPTNTPDGFFDGNESANPGYYTLLQRILDSARNAIPHEEDAE
ncbi:MAG: diacylglycerol kinase family lipid kinase [Chloroflexi bacterium]|nr:diacylglycerol kinase family lipid kinase [Chloroflexota bacterium]